MKRILWFVAVLCMMSVSAVLPTSAATERNLLIEDNTTLTSGNGSFSYTKGGVLVLESTTDEGASVAITTDALMNIRNMRYLQMSLSADCAFNISLKVSGVERDFYPQLTGPSWYEAFQEIAPADGEGVTEGGVFTLSQDVVHYAEYNDFAIDASGYATVKTVFISIKGKGKLTLEHLILSSDSSFLTMSNHVGRLAEEVPLLPDYSLDITGEGQQDTSRLEALDGDGMHEGWEWDVIRPIIWLLGGTLVVVVVAVMAVRKKIPRRFNMDIFDDNEKS